jgi:hypothetical protein
MLAVLMRFSVAILTSSSGILSPGRKLMSCAMGGHDLTNRLKV